MVKHTQTICWLSQTNCLSVFDHFVGLFQSMEMCLCDKSILSYAFTFYLSNFLKTFWMKSLAQESDWFTLKSDSHLPKKKRVICLIESPINMMKNAFYFILKALFVLKLFRFLSRLFGQVGKTA